MGNAVPHGLTTVHLSCGLVAFFGHQICCGIAVFYNHFLGELLSHEETQIHFHLSEVAGRQPTN